MANWQLPFFSLLLAYSLSGQITTSQYGNERTGANLKEVTLNPANVRAQTFGKLFALEVDGDVYAQPLFLPRLAIPGKGVHDVLFVATEHDSVYAFDAEDRGAPLWKKSFVRPSRGIAPVPAEIADCPFISPGIGITSTPVLDPRSGTLYVLARTAENDAAGTRRFWQRLHALDVLTGSEKFGGPVVIRASIESANSGLSRFLSGPIDFGALRENPRAALTIANGDVYLTWASSCDVGPYHGWIMAYDAHTLKQVAVFNTSPQDAESGIWQSDTGPAVDASGNLYLSTGNGRFDANQGGRDYGDTLLKMATRQGRLVVADYFTPSEQDHLNATDGDLGSGGPLLIPQQPGSPVRLVVVGGKGAVIYVVNRDRMGKFVPGGNSHAVQTIKVGGAIMGAPAYWNGHLYYFPANDVLKDFAVQSDRLSAAPVARGMRKIVDPGATPSISADGAKDGIVWVLETKGWRSDDRPAVLSAYDAANVANEIYDSEIDSARDRAGIARRFVTPVVANGHVYVATSGEIDVYGLLSRSPLRNPRLGAASSSHHTHSR